MGKLPVGYGKAAPGVWSNSPKATVNPVSAACTADGSLRLYRYSAPGKLILPIQTPTYGPSPFA